MAATSDELRSVPAITIRQMLESDVPAIHAIERMSYPFPWSEGIFRDCIRVGYSCRVFDLEGQIMGYGVMSTPAVVINGKVVHAGGLPARDKVEQWLSA